MFNYTHLKTTDGPNGDVHTAVLKFVTGTECNGIRTQKKIMCPECKGNGYNSTSILDTGFNTIRITLCCTCKGEKYIYKTLTNGDLIRDMDDSELAIFLSDLILSFRK